MNIRKRTAGLCTDEKCTEVCIRKLKKMKKVLAFLEKILYDKQVARMRHRIWRVGQEVKTPPSHGGIRGSIPLLAVDYLTE